jgi:TPP-dependent pyruvate/acetoin dehydrogenase alpha subunit
MKTGRAVVDFVRQKGPAILQVHTYRFTGHSPADPEHFEETIAKAAGISEEELDACRADAR